MDSSRFLVTNVVIDFIERVDGANNAEDDGDDNDDGNEHDNNAMNSDNGAEYLGSRDEINAVGFYLVGSLFEIIDNVIGAIFNNKLAAAGFAGSVAFAGFKFQISTAVWAFFLNKFHEYMIA